MPLTLKVLGKAQVKIDTVTYSSFPPIVIGSRSTTKSAMRGATYCVAKMFSCRMEGSEMAPLDETTTFFIGCP